MISLSQEVINKINDYCINDHPSLEVSVGEHKFIVDGPYYDLFTLQINGEYYRPLNADGEVGDGLLNPTEIIQIIDKTVHG